MLTPQRLRKELMAPIKIVQISIQYVNIFRWAPFLAGVLEGPRLRVPAPASPWLKTKGRLLKVKLPLPMLNHLCNWIAATHFLSKLSFLGIPRQAENSGN